MNSKLIAFDLDGVLINSVDVHTEDIYDYCELYSQYYGKHHVTYFENDPMCLVTYARPGMYNILKKISLTREIAVFSAGSDWYVNTLLNIFYPDITFKVILTAEDCFVDADEYGNLKILKPLLKLEKKTGIRKDDILMIEDNHTYLDNDRASFVVIDRFDMSSFHSENATLDFLFLLLF